LTYRNKTYIAFDGKDLHAYRLMQAWKKNENIEFDFYDAHDLNTALDTSKPETIIVRLRERLANAKQVILLVSETTRSKAADKKTFLHYEVEAIRRRELPVVFANLNGSRIVQSLKLPESLASDYYTMSVSWQPKIIMTALNDYAAEFCNNLTARSPKTGPYYYKDSVYKELSL
jgi:hypothetical protein